MSYCYKTKETSNNSTNQKDKTKENKESAVKTSWQPKQFRPIQFKKPLNKVVTPVIQRRVAIQKGIDRQLMNGAEVLASIEGDISEKISFSPSGLQEIANPELRNIATQNNGTLTSFDILTYLAAKGQTRTQLNAGQREAGQPEQLTTEAIHLRRHQWAEHLFTYDRICFFTNDFIQFSINLIEHNKMKKSMGDKLLEWLDELSRNESILNYAGKDFYIACLYILTNRKKSGQDFLERARNCLQEVQRRFREMLEEMKFCLKEVNQSIPDNPPDTMFGFDCNGFATAYQSAIHYTNRPGERKSIGAYRSVTGYSGHFFIWLTNHKEQLHGGVTVETCAGKGGIMRAVFSIRPVEENLDNPIYKLDKETITSGFNQVNQDNIRNDYQVMKYHLQKTKEFLENKPRKENGKIRFEAQMFKEKDFSEILRVYYKAVDGEMVVDKKFFDKELFPFFQKNFELDDRNFVKLG